MGNIANKGLSLSKDFGNISDKESLSLSKDFGNNSNKGLSLNKDLRNICKGFSLQRIWETSPVKEVSAESRCREEGDDIEPFYLINSLRRIIIY